MFGLCDYQSIFGCRLLIFIKVILTYRTLIMSFHTCFQFGLSMYSRLLFNQITVFVFSHDLAFAIFPRPIIDLCGAVLICKVESAMSAYVAILHTVNRASCFRSFYKSCAMLTSVFAFDTFAIIIPNMRSTCNYNRITAIVFLLVCGCRSSPFCCSGMIVLVKLTIFLMANLTFSLFCAGSCATLMIASVSAQTPFANS